MIRCCQTVPFPFSFQSGVFLILFSLLCCYVGGIYNHYLITICINFIFYETFDP